MDSPVTHQLVLLLALGVAAQWLAWRWHFPVIVLLSLAGLAAGPGLGWLNPQAMLGELLHPLIGLGVAVILFDGGLNLRAWELKTARAGVGRLTSVAALLSFTLGAGVAHWIGGLSWPVALVLGAILVVTGPTTIMPMLRHAGLNARTAAYLKWEAIINDPVGALLAVVIFQYFVFSGTDGDLLGALIALGLAGATAILLGMGSGYMTVEAFRRGYVPEYLKGPGLRAVVLAVCSASNAVQSEAGLLSVTLMGLTVGNLGLPSIDEMRRFKEYITILLVSGVFLLLTADLDPALLGALDWRLVALVAAMMLAVRPLAVLLAMLGSNVSWRDRLLLAWIAPRGIVAAAVAGVFAPEMAAAGYADAQLLVPVVFAMVFATVLANGLTLGWLARRLGLASSARQGVLIVGASPWTTELTRVLSELEVPVLLADSSWHRLRDARLAGLPVYFGEVLSERAEESLELSDIAVLLAATSNDAYNALVCNSLAPELRQENVYQLPMDAADEGDPRGVARGVRGNIAFSETAVIDELLRRHHAGWSLRRTRLTERYSYEDHLRQCPQETLQLLTVAPDGTVTPGSVQHPVAARAGDTVVWFAPDEMYGTSTADDGRAAPPD